MLFRGVFAESKFVKKVSVSVSVSNHTQNFLSIWKRLDSCLNGKGNKAAIQKRMEGLTSVGWTQSLVVQL